MLIVNADDFGYDIRTTDEITRCLAEGVITSTTAMVFMSDSERASEIASEFPHAVGLHLNFDEAFTRHDVPATVRERHRSVIEAFTTTRYRRWIYDPRIRRLVDDSIQDQLERFHRLYGHPPTHFDGHHHIHMCPNVFLSSTIPPGSKARRTSYRGRAFGAQMIDAARIPVIRRRLLTPAHYFSLRWLVPELGGSGAADKLREAARSSVEVMAHPGVDDERATLLSDPWHEILRDMPLASFADLR